MAVEREFGPSAGLKKLYQIYLTVVMCGGFAWWVIPGLLLAFLYDVWIGVVVSLSTIVPLILIAAVALCWIPRFHASIKYILGKDEITVTRGVWWTTKSVVPYNRITNISIYQGPISRSLRPGKLAIQTAGFSGVSSSGHKTAEAELIGISNFEEIKDHIMNVVKGMQPQAVEAEAETRSSRDLNEQVLEELRRIRKAVEE